MNFKAKLINGVIEIFPVVESIPNANGGNDIIVHALSQTAVNDAKLQLLNALARGEPTQIEVVSEVKDG